MQFLIRAYDAVVLGRPVTVLAFVTATVLGFATFAFDLQLDVSSDSLVLEHDADLRYYRAITARYGSDDYLIVTYTPHSDLFSPATLAKLGALRDELARLERVARVTSILDVPLLESPAIELADLTEGWPTLLDPRTDRDLARRELHESPLYSNRLVSADGGTTALQVDFRRDETFERLRRERDELRERDLAGSLTQSERAQLARVSASFEQHQRALMEREEADIANVRAVLDQYRDDAELHLGGVPMIAVDMMRFIRHDLIVFGIGPSSLFSPHCWVYPFATCAGLHDR